MTLWTDGCKGQYKGKKNFSIATTMQSVEFIHNFAATSQFKGLHDKIGHVAKEAVNRAEKGSVGRASTAYEFYRLLKEFSNVP